MTASVLRSAVMPHLTRFTWVSTGRAMCSRAGCSPSAGSGSPIPGDAGPPACPGAVA